MLGECISYNKENLPKKYALKILCQKKILSSCMLTKQNGTTIKSYSFGFISVTIKNNWLLILLNSRKSSLFKYAKIYRVFRLKENSDITFSLSYIYFNLKAYE